MLTFSEYLLSEQDQSNICKSIVNKKISTDGKSVDKYTMVDFLLDEQDIAPVEAQAKIKKHVKWKSKEQAQARTLDIISKGTRTD